MKDFTETYDSLLKTELTEVQKKIPVNDNPHNRQFWIGWYSAVQSFTANCNMPDDVYQYKLTYAKQQKEIAGNKTPKMYFWAGYIRGLGFSSNTYKQFIEYEKANGTYVKSKYKPRKITVVDRRSPNYCPF